MLNTTRKKIIAWLIPIMLGVLISGCSSEGDSILGPSTITSPTVIAVAPVVDGTNVPTNIKIITAQFSMPMLAATLNSSTFTLSKGSVVVSTGSVTYRNNTAELALISNLDVGTIYTVTITTGAKSAEGVALLSNFVWKFTTASSPGVVPAAAPPVVDTTPPTVSSTTPRNLDTNVALNKLITATFSEAMQSSLITTSTFKIKDTATATDVNGTVTYSVVNNIASFKPDVNLALTTNYTVTITTAVKDLAGNAMANAYSWTFTTSATQPIAPPSSTPIVVAVAPENNETNVSTSLQRVTAEFSIPMDLVTLTTTFKLWDNNNVPVAGTVSYNNKVAVFTITAPPLSINAEYNASISTGAKSLMGNALASDYNWSFTTGLLADATPPEVNSTDPINGELNVSIQKLITATFSKQMDPSLITVPLTFSVEETNGSINVDGNVTYSVLSKKATFLPKNDLKLDTNYTAIIKNTVEDLSGITMLLDYNWTFVTGSIIPPPLVQSLLVDLGKAATFGIASTAGITNTGATVIDGDVVLNPLDQCNAVTVDNAGGFGICGGTPPTINSGRVITPTYPDTTTAQPITDDLRAAYNSITPANMPGSTTIAAPTGLGGLVGGAHVAGTNYFTTGIYESGTSIDISGDLTLDAQNDPDATFVFQAGSSLTTVANTRILLVNGAKASNVYWQVGSSATLGTNTTWNGNIFAYASITMLNGAKSCGRLFAGAFTDGAFVFDSNRVSVPGNASAPVGCK